MNTSASSVHSPNVERPVTAANGWLCLGITILLFAAVPLIVIGTARSGTGGGIFVAVLLMLAGILMSMGFFTLQPNEAAVLTLFGAYRGTVRASGFFFTNPFNKRAKISLRARNINGEKLKVNEKRGNPIEIAAVVVWRVQDTAQAVFDVDNYENYVKIQSESAVRHVASSYAYDDGEANEITLRGGTDEVAAALTRELQERLAKAGVCVEEARLTHLAYAPEIAQAMLRRQQAEAMIAARQKIVHGAVSMVEMALHELSRNVSWRSTKSGKPPWSPICSWSSAVNPKLTR
jgi:regulator of protease activity HflC (stomatin/prohibitin superfamily)